MFKDMPSRGRFLYLFRIVHIDPKVDPSTKQNRLAVEQWRWIIDQVKELPTPDRAYFDSLHFGIYHKVMMKAKWWINEAKPEQTLELVAKPHRHFLSVIMTQANWKKATNIVI